MPPVCLDAPYLWMAHCMFDCLHMFGHPLHVWIPPCLDATICVDTPYVWMPLMFGHPHMFGCPHMFEHPAVCLGDVWMPPVHTQHIESMLCHTIGVSICPHTFECPICLDAPPVYLDAPHIWTPLICLDAPICLDTTHIFGCPHMFGCPAVCLDAPCMFGCPYMCSTAGNTFQPAVMLGCPHMFEHYPYVWTPPVCLDAHIYLDGPLYV